MSGEITEVSIEDGVEPLKELAPAIGDTKIAPAHGIAAIALSMAMKFHDIATVKDGAMYQQYKLEGKNMMPIHIDMVFETAIQIEAHLLGASERIAKLVVDAIVEEPDPNGVSNINASFAEGNANGSDDPPPDRSAT